MSDRGLGTSHGNDRKVRESMDASQSNWTSRWMQTSCNSALQVPNYFSRHNRTREKGCDSNKEPIVAQISEASKNAMLSINAAPGYVPEYQNSRRLQQGDTVAASNVPESAKEVGVTEARRVEITNETLIMNLRNLRNARPEFQPYAIFNFSKKVESILVPKKGLAICDVHASKSHTDDRYAQCTTTMESNDLHFPIKMLGSTPGTEFPSRECGSHPEGRSQSRGKSIKPYCSLAKKSLPVLRLFPDRLTGSTSDSMRHGFKSRGEEDHTFICRMEESGQSNFQVASARHLSSTDFTVLDHDNCTSHKNLICLDCDEKIDNQVDSMNSGSSYSGQKDENVKLCDPSRRNFCFPMSLQAEGNRIHEFNSTRLLPSNSCPVRVSRLEEMSDGCQSSPEIFSVHDVEKLRVSTAVNSVVEVPGGPPTQLTQSLSNRMSKGDNAFREATASTKFNGSASPEQFTLLPGFDCQASFGVNIQPQGSPTCSEGKGKACFLGLRNESSAETETMDINFCQTRKSLQSLALSTSNKDAMMYQNPALSSAISVHEEKVGSRMTETKSPDKNREPSTSFAAVGNMDLSASKTESLDLEHLFHVEQAGNSSFSPQQYGSLGTEPSSRGFKRLKSSTFDSDAPGTKSMKVGETSSSGRVNKLDSKIMSYGKTFLGRTFAKLLGKEQMELNKTMSSLQNKKLPPMLSLKERSWIQRWCHNQKPTKQMKPVTLVNCELESSKMALDEFRRKHFPSIGAMALLGKSMKGFQPCKFQRRGSLVVWSSE